MSLCCEYCGGVGKHHPRCPIYTPPKSDRVCCYCGEYLYNGDEFIEDNGECIHVDCIQGIFHLLEFLNIPIQTEGD